MTAYTLNEKLADRNIRVNAFDPRLTPGTGLAKSYPAILRFAWKNIMPVMTYFKKNTNSPKKSGRLLDDYFDQGQSAVSGLPTVQQLAQELNLSASYLSDMLRNLTGQNTQQYIQMHLIEKAKELLATTDLNIGKIAFRLGFEYSQSFSKLFKSKTNMTPMAFRASFNFS